VYFEVFFGEKLDLKITIIKIENIIRMFLSKIVSTFRYLPIKAITTKSVYRFTDRKIGIDEELLKWS